MKRRKLLFFGPAAAVLPTLSPAQSKQDGTVMAALKVEIFSDFQCPGCKQLHETALKQLREEFVTKGKIQLIHREFPLEIHKYAREAACLACAAEKLGKYGLVSDALFREQAVWSQSGKLDETLKKVLTPAELAKVRALAKEARIAAEVDADIALGKKLMAQVQTPTMVFTRHGKSQPVAGAISYPILRRYVEMLMAQ